MTIAMSVFGLKREDNIMSIATSKPVFSHKDDKIKDVINKMVSTGFRRMPIVSGKKEVVGIVTKTDILDAFLRKENFSEEISTIMIRDVIKCKHTDSIGYVLDKFKISRRGGFPIVKDAKLVGIISERDFVKKMPSSKIGLAVHDVMTSKPFIVTTALSILDCLRAIVNTKYRKIPVVEEGKLVGIISSADLMKYIHSSNYNYDFLDESITNIIVRNVITIEKEADVSEAVKKMLSNNIGSVIVVNEDKTLEGIITERDIVEELE